MSERIGRFSISEHLIHENIDAVKKFFEWLGCIVVKAEAAYWGRCIEYTAISDKFDEVPEGQIPPLYVTEVRREEDGSINMVGVVKV